MISVIVPIYNSEKTLERCLDSIIHQTYKNLEIILVNDGSKDKSLSIINKYALKDNRIVVIDQNNKGVSAARNEGLKKVHGEYILFVDSDDWLELDMIDKMFDFVNKYECDISFCGHDNLENGIVQNNADYHFEIWNNDQQLEEFLLHKTMTGMLWNKLIKTSLTHNIIFDEEVSYGEDAQFLWKVLKNCNQMFYTNMVLYHHTIEKNSISHQSFSTKKFSAIKVWEEIYDDVINNYSSNLKYQQFAKERLLSIAIYSVYEIKKSNYKNKNEKSYLIKIVRENIKILLNSKSISSKMKLYGLLIFLGL